MVVTRNRPVTMSTIAKDLDISRSTVSYVLSGSAKKKQISDKTIELVQGTAKRLNYTPNRLAQSLSLSHTGVISILFGELAYDWADNVVRGAISTLDNADYTPFIGVSLREASREKKEMRAVIERRDEGVICCPLPWGSSSYKMLIDHQVPFVFLGDTLLDMPDASFVAWDVGPAVEIAVKHMIESGRRKIGLIGSDYPTWSNKMRISAFQKVIKDEGLSFNNAWFGIEKVCLAPDRVIEEMFKPGIERPDALFVMDDSLALLTMGKLNQMGICIPDDVAIVGLGDLRESSHPMIGLTTVAEPTKELGRAAAEVLLELIKNPNKSPIKRLLPSTDLKIRKTT